MLRHSRCCNANLPAACNFEAQQHPQGSQERAETRHGQVSSSFGHVSGGSGKATPETPGFLFMFDFRAVFFNGRVKGLLVHIVYTVNKAKAVPVVKKLYQHRLQIAKTCKKQCLYFRCRKQCNVCKQFKTKIIAAFLGVGTLQWTAMALRPLP